MVRNSSSSRRSRNTLSATAAAAAMVLEALEVRRCLSASIDGDGILVVRGTAGEDMIDVCVSGSDPSKLWVQTEWDGGGLFNLADVKGIRIEGGAGDDLLTVDEWDGQAFPMGVTIVGGDGNDTLMGGAQDDVLLGGAGEDTLFATYHEWSLTGLPLDGAVRVGNDLLVGAGAGDVLDGEGTSGDFVGGASDWGSVVFHDGYVIVRGTAGNDVLTTMEYGDGGGRQMLNVELDWGGRGVSWNLDASAVKGVIVYGGQGNDLIAVSDGYDDYLTPLTVYGGAGDDTIVGGLADDLLVGGSGDDVIDGGAGGADVIDTDGDDAYSAPVTTPADSGQDETPVDDGTSTDDGETPADYADDMYAVPPSLFGTTLIGKHDQADDAVWA